jgi:hypothetical protein
VKSIVLIQIYLEPVFVTLEPGPERIEKTSTEIKAILGGFGHFRGGRGGLIEKVIVAIL